MCSTNQTLAIFFHCVLSVAMNTVEINSADVLFTESYGERRRQAAMEISPGKSRCYLLYHVYICQAGYLEVCVFAWFEVIKAKAQTVQPG